MIAKTYIVANLRSLDYKYRHASSTKEALFCSKLAILELCGWIEESMDELVRTCAVRHLQVPGNRTFCESEIIKRTYGFDYQKNFRGMLIRLIGLIAVERLERKVNQALYASLKATLQNLKVVRDAEAHTHLKGTTRILNAPSVTAAQFQTLYDGLKEFDRQIRRIHL